MEGEIVTLDPHRHDDNITFSVLGNIYDGLVQFDPKMTLVPALAQRWENPDDLTWLFHLQSGVSFHDGRILRAPDVVYSLERARTGPLRPYLAAVASIRMLDSLTVEIRTQKPSAVLLNKLTFIAIVPEGSPEEIKIPVGTGPYRFEDYRPGEGVRLQAFDRCWAGRPAIDRASIKFIPSTSQRIEALQRHQVDLIREIFGQSRELLAQDSTVAILEEMGLGVVILGGDLRRPGPLQNRLVRQAIYWSIDADEIIAATHTSGIPAHQFVSPLVVGYHTEQRDLWQHPQLERAKSALRRSGLRLPLKLDLELIGRQPSTLGSVMAQQLARAGIAVQLRGYDWPTLSARIDSGRSPFFMVSWSCSSGDASDFFESCLHTRDGTGYGTSNWGRYSNPQLDRLIEKCGRILDPRERIACLQRCTEMAWEDLPVIPLYVRKRTYGVCRSLSFVPRLDGRIRLQELSWLRPHNRERFSSPSGER